MVSIVTPFIDFTLSAMTLCVTKENIPTFISEFSTELVQSKVFVYI